MPGAVGSFGGHDLVDTREVGFGECPVGGGDAVRHVRRAGAADQRHDVAPPDSTHAKATWAVLAPWLSAMSVMACTIARFASRAAPLYRGVEPRKSPGA